MQNQPSNQGQGQQKQMQIKISDDILRGSYANAMQVAHSKEEFTLDFLNLSPHMGAGIVNARVIMSPGHVKRVVAALQDNIKRYEDSHGKVEEASRPDGEIGFQA